VKPPGRSETRDPGRSFRTCHNHNPFHGSPTPMPLGPGIMPRLSGRVLWQEWHIYSPEHKIINATRRNIHTLYIAVLYIIRARVYDWYPYRY
jgi:hypothetical protein